MKITLTKTEDEFDNLAAWRIIGEILYRPNAVIGLSTGRTTHNMHKIVSEIYTQHPFDVSQVTFFGLDEVTNVPRTYAGSCYTKLRTEIIDALGIPENRFLMLPTVSDDFPVACSDFQRELTQRGGIDLLILGLGENGHLGFNQPGSPFEGETTLSSMDAELEARIRRETQTPPEIAIGGVTLGLKNIMQARKIILVAKGKRKASIVKAILESPITPDIPGSILQLHPNCEYLLQTDTIIL